MTQLNCQVSSVVRSQVSTVNSVSSHLISPASHLSPFTFCMASNLVAALAVSQRTLPKLNAQFSNLKEKVKLNSTSHTT